ncbi:SAM-dependent methyltransferase [Streptomyces sp. NPDC054796]
MEMRQYREIIEDREARGARYRDMLPAFYEFATTAYRNNWAESFHLPPFKGHASLAEALAAQEHELASAAGFRQGMRLLDLGCGIGGPALSIARHTGAHVTGVNIVPMQVRLARAKASEQQLSGQAEFEVADMTDLPFPDASFDGAFSFDAICHAPDKPAVYAEAGRVLKPGAVFSGCDWLCADGLSAARYQESIEPVCAFAALPSVLTLGEVSRELTAAGFTVEECHDLADEGDMAPNWELFERAAATIPAPRTGASDALWRHATSTARAGRSGEFLVGAWRARKTRDSQ